jgi:hypothetical protein
MSPFPFEDFKNWREKSAPLGERVLKEVARGCIGLTAVFQTCPHGEVSVFPNLAPGTSCFIIPAAAADTQCPKGKTQFLFTVEGEWRGGKAPKVKKPTDPIPNNDAIVLEGGHFNYITRAGGNFCVWMNHMRQNSAGQKIGFDKPEDPIERQVMTLCRQAPGQPCSTSSYKAKVWCVTCKNC